MPKSYACVVLHANDTQCRPVRICIHLFFKDCLILNYEKKDFIIFHTFWPRCITGDCKLSKGTNIPNDISLFGELPDSISPRFRKE